MATATKRSSGSTKASGSKSFGKLILGLLLIVLIIGASVAATYFFLDKSGFLNSAIAGNVGEEQQRQPQAPLPAPIFASLEPFTVTLRDERTTRILYLAITLRLVDDVSRQTVTEYMPEVRDRVLRLLSIQNPTYIQTPEGRQRLVQDLTELLQRPYLPQPRGPEISAVLFTAFVVQ